MGWLIVLPARGMVATTELGAQVAMEVEINRSLLENTLTILFLKIMVHHIPHIDRTAGEFRM